MIGLRRDAQQRLIQAAYERQHPLPKGKDITWLNITSWLVLLIALLVGLHLLLPSPSARQVALILVIIVYYYALWVWVNKS